MALLFGGAVKFYHYNYVTNTFGQARALRLVGLREFVCKGIPEKKGAIDQCGSRSIYGDADWGITGYIIIFGVESYDEAKSIANFMVASRKASHQEHIPMNLEVYSIPRSEAKNGHPSEYKIFDQDL